MIPTAWILAPLGAIGACLLASSLLRRRRDREWAAETRRRRDREWWAGAAGRIREVEDFAAWEREITSSRRRGAEQ